MAAKIWSGWRGPRAGRPAVPWGSCLRSRSSAARSRCVCSRTRTATRSSAAPRRRSGHLDDDQDFGGGPVVILIREPLTGLVETKDLATVSQLEACLAGQVVVANQARGVHAGAGRTATPYGGWGSPCGKLMKAKPAQVVYGPGTFLEPRRGRGQHRDRADHELGSADDPDREDKRVQARAGQSPVEAEGDLARERRGSIATAAGDHAPAPDVPELRNLAVSRRSTIRSSSRRSCSTRPAA